MCRTCGYLVDTSRSCCYLAARLSAVCRTPCASRPSTYCPHQSSLSTVGHTLLAPCRYSPASVFPIIGIGTGGLTRHSSFTSCQKAHVAHVPVRIRLTPATYPHSVCNVALSAAPRDCQEVHLPPCATPAHAPRRYVSGTACSLEAPD